MADTNEGASSADAVPSTVVGTRTEDLVPEALSEALEQSAEARAKVEAVADDLDSMGESVQRKLADGATAMSARSVLRANRGVKESVDEVALDLHSVVDSLAKGLEELRQTSDTLADVQEALQESEAALGVAQAETADAERRAMHDAATGLPNRDLFNDRAAQAIALAGRTGVTVAVMFLDLNDFKTINDSHGHAVGDVVLKEIASRLIEHSRDEDTICRAGGDEFLYLLLNAGTIDDLRHVATRLIERVCQVIAVGDVELSCRPSIGISIYPAHGTSVSELVAHADAAMYEAKKSGAGVAVYARPA